MINITELDDNSIGREVCFTYNHGEKVYGHLTSWNEENVFVKFKGPTGEACNPKNCAFTLIEFESKQTLREEDC